MVHLRPVHIVHFFLIATAFLSIARNGLHRTKWKRSHYATAITSPIPMQSIVSKNKSQSQIAQCELALNGRNEPRETNRHKHAIKCTDNIKGIKELFLVSFKIQALNFKI